MTTLTIEFPSDHEAMAFALWLSRGGEQDFYEFVAEGAREFCAQYHPQPVHLDFCPDVPRTRATFDGFAHEGFVPDWTIRTKPVEDEQP